ncbi:response regulator [Parvularcula sp. ZS-1/3]|uniref:Response regulator n=1 Tax=Parvularcula mediterranea TaxID=2732508 RepID=A0A7Y3W520_9PROT|nr:response regulator [Parvularcula mediterranea]NNU16164.1 response regulator [Parvularcula mediterranea]
MSRTAATFPARTVFIIEDDAAVRDSLCMVVRGAGYVVRDFPEGRVFLDQARPSSGDVVILDIDLPMLSGVDIVDELRIRGWICPILVISGLRAAAFSQGVAQIAPYRAFRKPLDHRELLTALHTA